MFYKTFTTSIFLSLKCLTIFLFMALFIACTYNGGGEGGLNFCHFGACILLNDPFRLVVFILNGAGWTWTFFVEKIQSYFFGPKIVTDEVKG